MVLVVASNVSSPSRTQAPVAAVFAGSPQLLGTVKLCSGLAVTSLPLYSDINLLRRSEDVSALHSRETFIIRRNKQKTLSVRK